MNISTSTTKTHSNLSNDSREPSCNENKQKIEQIYNDRVRNSTSETPVLNSKITPEKVDESKGGAQWSFWGWWSKTNTITNNQTPYLDPTEKLLQDLENQLKKMQFPKDFIAFIDAAIPNIWLSYKKNLTQQQKSSFVDKIQKYALSYQSIDQWAEDLAYKSIKILILKVIINVIQSEDSGAGAHTPKEQGKIATVIDKLVEKVADGGIKTLHEIRKLAENLDAEKEALKQELTDIQYEFNKITTEAYQIDIKLYLLARREIEYIEKKKNSINAASDEARQLESMLGRYATLLGDLHVEKEEMPHFNDDKSVEWLVNDYSLQMLIEKKNIIFEQKNILTTKAEHLIQLLENNENQKKEIFVDISKKIFLKGLPKGAEDIHIPGRLSWLTGRWLKPIGLDLRDWLYSVALEKVPALLFDFREKALKNDSQVHSDKKAIEEFAENGMERPGGKDLVHFITFLSSNVKVILRHFLSSDNSSVATRYLAGLLDTLDDVTINDLGNLFKPFLLHIIRNLSGHQQVDDKRQVLTLVIENILKTVNSFMHSHGEFLNDQTGIVQFHRQASEIIAKEEKIKHKKLLEIAFEDAFSRHAKYMPAFDKFKETALKFDIDPSNENWIDELRKAYHKFILTFLVENLLSKGDLYNEQLFPQALNWIPKAIEEGVLNFFLDVYENAIKPLGERGVEVEENILIKIVDNLIKTHFKAIQGQCIELMESPQIDASIISFLNNTCSETSIKGHLKLESQYFFSKFFKEFIESQEVYHLVPLIEKWLKNNLIIILNFLSKGEKKAIESILLNIVRLFERYLPYCSSDGCQDSKVGALDVFKRKMRTLKKLPTGIIKEAKRQELIPCFAALARQIVQSCGGEEFCHLLFPKSLKKLASEMIEPLLANLLLELYVDVHLTRELPDIEQLPYEKMPDQVLVDELVNSITTNFFPYIKNAIKYSDWQLVDLFNWSAAGGSLSLSDQACIQSNLQSFFNNEEALKTIWDLLKSYINQTLKYAFANLALKGPWDASALENILLYIAKIPEVALVGEEITPLIGLYASIIEFLQKKENELEGLRAEVCAELPNEEKISALAKKKEEVENLRLLLKKQTFDELSKTHSFGTLLKKLPCEGLRNFADLEERLISAFKPHSIKILKDMGFKKPEDIPHIPSFMKDLLWEKINTHVFPLLIIKLYMNLSQGTRNKNQILESIKSLGLTVPYEESGEVNIGELAEVTANSISQYLLKYGLNFFLTNISMIRQIIALHLGLKANNPVPGISTSYEMLLQSFGKNGFKSNAFLVEVLKDEVASIILEILYQFLKKINDVEKVNPEKNYDIAISLIKIFNDHLTAVNDIVKQQNVMHIHEVRHNIVYEKYSQKAKKSGETLLHPTFKKTDINHINAINNAEATVKELRKDLSKLITECNLKQHKDDLIKINAEISKLRGLQQTNKIMKKIDDKLSMQRKLEETIECNEGKICSLIQMIESKKEEIARLKEKEGINALKTFYNPLAELFLNTAFPNGARDIKQPFSEIIFSYLNQNLGSFFQKISFKIGDEHFFNNLLITLLKNVNNSLHDQAGFSNKVNALKKQIASLENSYKLSDAQVQEELRKLKLRLDKLIKSKDTTKSPLEQRRIELLNKLLSETYEASRDTHQQINALTKRINKRNVGEPKDKHLLIEFFKNAETAITPAILTSFASIKLIRAPKEEVIEHSIFPLMKEILDSNPLTKVAGQMFIQCGKILENPVSFPLTIEECALQEINKDREIQFQEIEFKNEMGRLIDSLKEVFEDKLENRIPIIGTILKWLLKPLTLLVCMILKWKARSLAPHLLKNAKAYIHISPILSIFDGLKPAIAIAG